jgi:hypothetical protein
MYSFLWEVEWPKSETSDPKCTEYVDTLRHLLSLRQYLRIFYVRTQIHACTIQASSNVSNVVNFFLSGSLLPLPIGFCYRQVATCTTTITRHH